MMVPTMRRRRNVPDNVAIMMMAEVEREEELEDVTAISSAVPEMNSFSDSAELRVAYLR